MKMTATGRRVNQISLHAVAVEPLQPHALAQNRIGPGLPALAAFPQALDHIRVDAQFHIDLAVGFDRAATGAQQFRRRFRADQFGQYLPCRTGAGEPFGGQFGAVDGVPIFL